MTAPRVAIAVSRGSLDRDADTPLLVEALAAVGVSSRPARWDDPGERWAEYELVVVRSTWDYVGRLEEFLAWAASVPRLVNPPDVLRWNTDKRYLRELGAAGVPVAPTVWVPVGERPDLPPGELVVKPAVSNGARDTGRYGPGDEDAALAHVERLHAAGRLVMVQPYIEALDVSGETGVVVIGGQPSHAIVKGPRLVGRGISSLGGSEGVVAGSAGADELALASRVLDLVPGGPQRLLYARVDLVPGAGGAPMLLELEVSEPSLFLALCEGAAGRLAREIVRWLDRAR